MTLIARQITDQVVPLPKGPIAMLDLTVAKDAISLVKNMHATARKNFLRDGYLQQACFVIATCRPDGVSLEHPSIVPTILQGSPTKDQMADAFHTICKKTKAIGFILIHECWWVGGNFDLAEKGLKWHEAHGSLAECPGRQEVLYCSLEHRGLPSHGKSWTALIHRDGDKVTVDEFEEMPTTMSEGRMTNFLSFLS